MLIRLVSFVLLGFLCVLNSDGSRKSLLKKLILVLIFIVGDFSIICELVIVCFILVVCYCIFLGSGDSVVRIYSMWLL